VPRLLPLRRLVGLAVLEATRQDAQRERLGRSEGGAFRRSVRRDAG
jgi:hypothetical protein